MLYTDVNSQPDQATFIPPSTLAAKYNAQALWVEDEVTVNRRLTFKVGVRYDDMKGVSPDVAAFDNNLEETGQTIQGLGDMFTWDTFSPRAGVNVKLTNDDKTVLRGTVGRYYRPIILSDFTGVYPGVSTQDLYRYNQATRQYDIFISSVSPNANLAVDSNMDAPYTDQVLGRHRPGTRPRGGLRRELRAQERAEPDWVGGYRRCLRHGDDHRVGVRTAAAVDGVSAAQFTGGALISADQRPRFLQPVPTARSSR